jgi:cytochrome c oxidase cbb3-type subunit 4
METYSMFSSIFTVLSFVVFLGIVLWAWSSRRNPAFDAAAIEPFALPDEAGLWQPTSSTVPLKGEARSDTITSKGARR